MSYSDWRLCARVLGDEEFVIVNPVFNVGAPRYRVYRLDLDPLPTFVATAFYGLPRLPFPYGIAVEPD